MCWRARDLADGLPGCRERHVRGIAGVVNGTFGSSSDAVDLFGRWVVADVSKGTFGTFNVLKGTFEACGRRSVSAGRCPEGHLQDAQRLEGHLQDVRPPVNKSKASSRVLKRPFEPPPMPRTRLTRHNDQAPCGCPPGAARPAPAQRAPPAKRRQQRVTPPNTIGGYQVERPEGALQGMGPQAAAAYGQVDMYREMFVFGCGGGQRNWSYRV